MSDSSEGLADEGLQRRMTRPDQTRPDWESIMTQLAMNRKLIAESISDQTSKWISYKTRVSLRGLILSARYMRI